MGGNLTICVPRKGILTSFRHLGDSFSSLLCMYLSLGSRVWVVAILSSSVFAFGQTQREQPTAACPAQPATLRAMHGCYRALLVFAPALDSPQLVEQFNQLKPNAVAMRSRKLLYVPIVPEGHNQPIPTTRVPTARLSEDELAAVHHRFKVEPGDFLVILIGEDGGQKLDSKTPVTMDQLDHLIDSMPMRQKETQQEAPPQQ